VTSRPSKGTFVEEFSEKDVHELYSIRLILETEAIRLTIQKANQEDIDDLRTILKALFDAAEAGDYVAVLDNDIAFHKRIWRISNHSLLERYLQEISVQIKMYIAIQTSRYDYLVSGISDHGQLLAAIEDKDEEQAIRILHQHLQVATDTLLNYHPGKDV
jgi:DNA-binding GntR family transcriptional regulator